MASIYDKALKRKDFSGIVDGDAGVSKALAADNAKILHAASTSGANSAGAAGANGHGQEGAGKKMSKEERKKAEDKRDESKAGADVGKIVNLMAGDANRVSAFLCCSFRFCVFCVGVWARWMDEEKCGVECGVRR